MQISSKWWKRALIPLTAILVWVGPLGGPFGSGANIATLSLRSLQGETQEQKAELAFYECLEDAASPIPDSEIAEVVVSNDFGRDGIGYLEQRLDEILFPTIRISAEGATYRYSVFPFDSVGPAELENYSQSRATESLFRCSYALVLVEKLG